MADYIHFDRGVRVTRQPDARGYYRIRYTDPATNRPADARRRTWHEAEALAYDLAGGLARIKAGNAEHAHQPLAHLIDDHLENPRGRYQPQSLRTHRTYLGRYVREPFGHLPCSQWGRQLTLTILAAAEADGLAGNTQANLLRALGGLAETGRLLQYLPAEANPTGGIRISNRRQVDLTDLPTAADIDRLADALNNQGEPWWALHALLPAYSGLRAGEVCGLQAGDIDPVEGTIRVDRQILQQHKQTAPPKYGSRRVTIFPAWMDQPIQAAVEAAGRPDAPLLPNAYGEPMSYRTYKDRFDQAAAQAGWKARHGNERAPWTPHTLRHFFCTWALARQPDGLGLDVADVSRFAGHRDPSVTWSIYVESRPDRVARAREASRNINRKER